MLTSRLGLVLAFCLPLAALAAQNGRPRIECGEPGDATPQIADLVQQSPRPGEPTPYRTSVLVTADRDRLVIRVDCADPDPDKIAIHTMQRDGDMEGDDIVTIALDTFGDGRTGYYFRINAAGAKLDGLISAKFVTSTDWDGVWDAHASITPSGWTATFEIPVRTLRFDASLGAWGFNVERRVARERMTLRWVGTTLDSALSDMSRTGLLGGVSRFRQGLGLSVTLNSIARHEKDFVADREATTGDLGVDVGYNLTPQLGAVLTVNTDFAETEVDTRQINLTRFPLFFPEKRSFFLEGSNQFAFGYGLDEVFLPFYSRRIGLVGGRTVPLDAGLKVLGRAGRWSIGALDVRAGDTDGLASANLFVGRASYDVDSHLRVGAIFTNGDPRGETSNRLGGVDAVWTTSELFGDKNLTVSAWGARSEGDRLDGRRSGWGAAIDYPNDLWDLSASVNEYGDGLDPALGFLPRPGTRQYHFGMAWQPRPSESESSWIRQYFFELYPRIIDDLDGNPESWRIFTAPFNAETRGGTHLEANWTREFERIDAPFEISDGVVIPVGKYRYDRFRVEIETPEDRALRFSNEIWFGDFYDGRLTQIESSVGWASTTGRLSIQLDTEQNFARLAEGNFIQRFWQLRGVYAFSPNLILSSNTQYDSESREVGTNTRLRWTIRPEADLFVVWNRGWRRPFDREEGDLVPLADQFAVKLKWIVRR